MGQKYRNAHLVQFANILVNINTMPMYRVVVLLPIFVMDCNETMGNGHKIERKLSN